MSRIVVATGVLVALLAMGPEAQAKTIQIYQDGVCCPLEVPDDFEFYEVECADIRTGNKDVIMGGCLGQPGRLTLGASRGSEGADAQRAETYGRHGSGLWASDYYAQRLLGPASWQEARGEYVDQRDWQIGLDQSTSDLSFDALAFSRSGYVWGFDAAGALSQTVRNRRFYDATLRRGSMDGGSWRLRQTYMESGIGAGQTQAQDSRLWRSAAGFRSVECGWQVDSELYYGKYSSAGALINNEFSGASVNASYELDPQWGAEADAELTRIDVGLDNQAVTRSNAAGRLTWEANDELALSGELRRVHESNEVVITSHLKSYTDLVGAVHYTPGSDLRLSADYRHREVDAERIRLEDPAIYGFYFGAPPVQRADLDALREQTSASGDFLNLRGRLRIDDSWQLSADYSSVKWGDLPQNGKFSGGQALEASYFSDSRRLASLRLARDYCGGGQLVFDASDNVRSNGPRDSEYNVRRLSAAYSAPLWNCQRYNLGLSRFEARTDLAGTVQDSESESWDFDAGLSGEADWASYRLNYTRQMLEGSWAGDYDSLALDLVLAQSPLSISAWWRERADGPAGGFAGYSDLGLRLGYSVDLD